MGNVSEFESIPQKVLFYDVGRPTLEVSFLSVDGRIFHKKKSREMIESLQYAAKILDNPDNLLLIFPEGKLQSLYNPLHVFEKGIERIVEGHKNNFQLVFVANFIDYLSHKKPDLYMYVSEYQGNVFSHSKLQEAYNVFYGNCLDIQKSKTE